MRRSIKIMIVHIDSRGEEGLTTVGKVTIPNYITKSKDSAECKDKMLDDYINTLSSDIKEGLDMLERQREINSTYDW